MKIKRVATPYMPRNQFPGKIYITPRSTSSSTDALPYKLFGKISYFEYLQLREIYEVKGKHEHGHETKLFSVKQVNEVATK